MRKSLQELGHKINPAKIKSCRACGLYLNQLPAYDTSKSSNIFWVGLSAVQFSDDDERVPLSSFTRSGALLAEIELIYPKTLFYKTNLVKCLPLAKDKIRYPIKEEMERCYTNFADELRTLRPKLVFLLGKQVASFVYQKIDAGIVELNDDFEFDAITAGGVTYVPVHHPSFILVYKRQSIQKYVKGIRYHISRSLTKGTHLV